MSQVLPFVLSLVRQDAGVDDGRLDALFGLIDKSLTARKSVEVLPLLVEGISGKDHRVVAVCARLLSHYLSPSCDFAERFWSLLGHSEPSVRCAVLAAARKSVNIPLQQYCNWPSLLIDDSVYVQREAHLLLALLFASGGQEGERLVTDFALPLILHPQGTQAERAVVELQGVLLRQAGERVGNFVVQFGLLPRLVERFVLQPSTETNAALAVLRTAWQTHTSCVDAATCRDWVNVCISRGMLDVASMLLASVGGLCEVVVEEFLPLLVVAFLNEKGKVRNDHLVRLLQVLKSSGFSTGRAKICTNILSLSGLSAKVVRACCLLLAEWEQIVSVEVVLTLLDRADSTCLKCVLGLYSDWNDERLVSFLGSLLASSNPILAWDCITHHLISSGGEQSNILLFDLAVNTLALTADEQVICHVLESFFPKCLSPNHHVTRTFIVRFFKKENVSCDVALLDLYTKWDVEDSGEELLQEVIRCVTRCVDFEDDWTVPFAAAKWLELHSSSHPNAQKLWDVLASHWARPIKVVVAKHLGLHDQMELDNSSEDPVDELEYGMSLLLLKGPDKPLECCD